MSMQDKSHKPEELAIERLKRLQGTMSAINHIQQPFLENPHYRTYLNAYQSRPGGQAVSDLLKQCEKLQQNLQQARRTRKPG